MDRDKPVAEILPISDSRQNKEGDLSLLESQGLIRRGDTSKLKSFKPSLGKKNAGVLKALLSERKEGR